MHGRLLDLLAGDGTGPVLGVESQDLNVTVLVWPPGHVVAEHVNEERDVLLVCLDGHGVLDVDGERLALRPGAAVLVPAGAARRLETREPGIRYVAIHRRRGGLSIARLSNVS